jgi:CheY-like chemotaxis protein
MDARLIVIIGKDRVLQDVLRLSGDDLDVFVTRSCTAPPLITDGSFRQVVVLDFSVEGCFELLSQLKALPRTAVIGLTDSPDVSTKLKAQGIQTVYPRAVTTDLMLEGVRDSIAALPGVPPRSDVHILVVDDEKDIRDLLYEALRKAGYFALKTGDGNVALQMIENNPDIALVLLDIRIEGRGGLEVLAEIRQHRPDIGVIMVTGLVDREIARQTIRMGAFDYLIKPFDVAVLPDLIAAALSHREYLQLPWWKRLIG